MNQLHNEPPEVWLAYLLRVERGADADLSMQVIYHFAAPRAKDGLNLGWAAVAIRAAEIDAHTCVYFWREELLISAMGLRAWFIARIGSQLAHPVLDKQLVLDWVMSGLDAPLPIVREKAESLWENLAEARISSNPDDLRRMTQELRELRGIKRRLFVARVLADSDHLPADSVLHGWLDIQSKLP